MIKLNKQYMNPPDLVNPQDKVCCKCHSKKPINEFNKCKTGVYGYKNENTYEKSKNNSRIYNRYANKKTYTPNRNYY